MKLPYPDVAERLILNFCEEELASSELLKRYANKFRKERTEKEKTMTSFQTFLLSSAIFIAVLLSLLPSIILVPQVMQLSKDNQSLIMYVNQNFPQFEARLKAVEEKKK